MPEISKKEVVQDQYASGDKLSIRRKLHDKHSTNRYGLHNWLFDQYRFPSPAKILEIGCGTGGLWENRIDALPENSQLILSDFSQGMVDHVAEKYGKHSHVLAMQMDIQAIPFGEGSFDAVIANHMLYHVPNLPKALEEVCRVLKPGGTFYASTNGTEGIPKYLHQKLTEFNPRIKSFYEEHSVFTLQNGGTLLEQHFQNVTCLEYEDALHITETQDLVDWIHSAESILGVTHEELDGIYDFFEAIRLKEGTIHIPKQSGTFTAKNPN